MIDTKTTMRNKNSFLHSSSMPCTQKKCPIFYGYFLQSHLRLANVSFDSNMYFSRHFTKRWMVKKKIIFFLYYRAWNSLPKSIEKTIMKFLANVSINSQLFMGFSSKIKVEEWVCTRGPHEYRICLLKSVLQVNRSSYTFTCINCKL